MVIWITGKPSSGKTTLATTLQERLSQDNKHSVIIDGDRIRKIVDAGYSDSGRYKNIMFAANLAKMAEEQEIIALVSLVSPKKEWRDKARSLFKESKLIYIPGGTLWKNSTYEEPTPEEASFIYNWTTKSVSTNCNHWIKDFLY